MLYVTVGNVNIAIRKERQDNNMNKKYKEEYLALKGSEELMDEKSKYNNNLYNHKIVFQEFERFEERLKKDICFFTREEVLNSYRFLQDREVSTVLRYFRIIKSYTKFCSEKYGIKDNHENIDTPDVMELFEVPTGKYITDKEVYRMLNYLKNYRDIFLLLALREGLYEDGGKDIWSLTEEDIEGNIFHLSSGRDVIVSDRLAQVAKLAANTYTYYSLNIYGENKPKCTEYALRDKHCLNDSQTGFKHSVYKLMYNQSADNESQMQKNIYKNFIRLKDFLRLPSGLKLNDFIMGGLVDRISQTSKKRGMSIEEFVYTREGRNILDRYGKRCANMRVLIFKIKGYLNE